MSQVLCYQFIPYMKKLLSNLDKFEKVEFYFLGTY